MAHASTIYALASAAGKSGVAVFRLSGPAARAGVTLLGVRGELEPRKATRVVLKTPKGELLDDALALFFPAPHSFTGEDVVELHTHGSRAVTTLLLDSLAALPGFHMAEPGEFARRAFLNGKLDLAQVEGLADLIDAETASQHQQAMRQLGGTTTQRVEALRMGILEPLALMEAYIDFPDEEIPESVLNDSQSRVAAITQEIQSLLDDGGIGEKIRDGLDIVILGAPNAGKSSLLNVLAKRDAAIVSPEAGTTRDLIEVPMEIGGYAVTLVDTAGLRDAVGNIEAEGIRRARQRAEHADITLLLCDITTLDAHALAKQLTPTTLVVATKSDLAPLPAMPFPVLAISTMTGAGIPELIAALANLIAVRMDSAASPFITRARHRAALNEALLGLQRFRTDAPLELVCEELRLAAASIGKITGKIWVDDVLDLVFSRFCIGK
ncbi:MAG: tRNA uridine-5-carboxymethylaminomethyl(34) synthesis GTPase MnmE [Rickettsiales bacterium]